MQSAGVWLHGEAARRIREAVPTHVGQPCHQEKTSKPAQKFRIKKNTLTRSNFAPVTRFILMGLMMDNGEAIYLRAQVVKIHELYFTHHVILYQN